MATKDSEKAPLFVVKRPGQFVPASAIDAEVFDRIANGSEVEITVKQRRSSRRLRLFRLMAFTRRWPPDERAAVPCAG